MKSTLLVLVALMAGVIGWLLARPNLEAQKLASARGQLAKAEEQIATLQRQVNELTKPSSSGTKTAASEATGASSVVASPSTPTEASQPPSSTKPKTAFREMMKAPGMQDMIRQQQKAQLPLQYGRLFKNFELNEEEQAHFEKLLLDRQMAQVESGMKMMEDGVTAEDRVAIAKEQQEQMKASDEAIRKFLNDEQDWEIFENWEDTKPERMQLEMFGRALFDGSDQPLTPAQEDQLVQTMTDVRKSPSPSVAAAPSPPRDPLQGMSEQQVNQFMEQQRQNHDIIAEKASTFLTPEQIETLRKFQDQQLSMTATGLKMSSMMLNEGSEP